jgi:hypothetical protein
VIDPALLQRLRSVAGDNFQELSGALVAGELPLTDALVNRLIRERLSASAGPLTSVEVRALDSDTFSARLTPRARFIPPVEVVGRFEQQPQMPERPLLVIRWSVPSIGPLGMLAAPALSFLKALPRGLRAEDDLILVDLTEILRGQGLGDLAKHLMALEVHTRRGAFVVNFQLGVR